MTKICDPLNDCPVGNVVDITRSTTAEKKALAEMLYRTNEWTMERIAEKLGVTHSTVSRWLDQFVQPAQTQPRTSKRGRKGEGRPKAAAPKEPAPRRTTTQAQDAAIATAHFEQGKSRQTIAAEKGIGEHAVQLAIARERGRREAEPLIDPDTLSVTAKQKVQAAINQYKRQLDAEQEQRVQDRIDEWMDKFRPYLEDAQKVTAGRKGLITKDEANAIMRCLHPDNSASDKMRNQAFVTWNRISNLIMNEQDAPTVIPLNSYRRKRKTG